MKKEYISIKEFAELAGVSQQAIYKRLNNRLNGLNKYLKVIDDKKMLEKSALLLFQKEEQFNQVEQLSTKFNNQLNDKIIDILQQELEEKNRQLREKDKQIEKLQELLEQSQKLNAMDKQILMEVKKETSKSEEEIIEQHPNQEEETAEEPKRGKGFWGWFRT